MADISITTDWTAPRHSFRRSNWLDRIACVHYRLARRNRYVASLIATIGLERAADLGIDIRSRRYPWFQILFVSMSGR